MLKILLVGSLVGQPLLFLKYDLRAIQKTPQNIHLSLTFNIRLCPNQVYDQKRKQCSTLLSVFNHLLCQSTSCVGLCPSPLPMMHCWQGSSSSCSLYLYDPFMKTSPLASQRAEARSNQYQLGREINSAKYSELQTWMVLAFIRLPEAKEVPPVFMFDLATREQQNMGTTKNIPLILTHLWPTLSASHASHTTVQRDLE